MPKINTNDISILNFNSIVMNLNSISTFAQKPVGNRSETVQSKSVTFGILQDSFPILFKGTGLQNPIWYAPEPHWNRFETVPKLLLNCPESASRTGIFSNEGQRLIKYWHMHREKTRMFVSSCWWFLFFCCVSVSFRRRGNSLHLNMSHFNQSSKNPPWVRNNGRLFCLPCLLTNFWLIGVKPSLIEFRSTF